MSQHTLQALVQSLTQSERRYVQLRLPAEKAYTAYFNALVTVDPAYLQSMGNTQRHLLTQQLLEVLLRHLSLYHRKRNPQAQLQYACQVLGTLYHYGLWELGLRMVTKYLPLALAHELWVPQRQLLEWQLAFISHYAPISQRLSILPGLLEQIAHNGTQQQNVEAHRAAYFRQYIRIAQQSLILVGNAASQAASDAYLPGLPPPTSQLASVYAHLAQANYLVQQGDMAGAFEAHAALATLLGGTARTVMAAHPSLYFEAMRMYMHLAQWLGDMPLALHILAQMQHFLYNLPMPSSLAQQLNLKLLHHEASLYQLMQQPRQSAPAVARIRQVLDSAADLPTNLVLYLQFNSALQYFQEGDSRMAARVFSSLGRQMQQGVSEDLHLLTFFIQLLLSLELGHTDLLDAQLRAILRRLHKQPMPLSGNFSQIFVRYLKKLALGTTRANTLPAMQALGQELAEKASSPADRLLLGYVDYKGWLKL